MHSLRARAFGKLATLSASPVPSSRAAPNTDLERLCGACAPARQESKQPNGFAGGTSAGKVPMGTRELEVLLALCQAGPSIDDFLQANRLIKQIAPYVPESCYQAFAPSPQLHDIKSSPWATLSYSLTDATLKIGQKHPSLKTKAAENIAAYVANCVQQSSAIVSTQVAEKLVDSHGTPSSTTASTVALAASLIGFLEACSRNAAFFSPKEQLETITGLQTALSDKFLTMVESTLSSIRTSNVRTGFVREWKQYIRHYAATGRPFGALALQKGLMNLVRAFTSTFMRDGPTRQDADVLQEVMDRLPDQKRLHFRADPMLASTLANVAAQEIANVDAGSDYLQMGSAWQQQLGHSVKASSLVAYLFCSLANEEAADQERLLTWLDAALSDPIQATNQDLANAVLKCLAILALRSASSAMRIKSSIQAFLIGGSVTEAVAIIAAESLLFVLKTLPQGDTATTLYTLGNTLSSSGNPDSAGHFALFNDVPMLANGTPTANGNGTANGYGAANGDLLNEKRYSSLNRSPSSSFVQTPETFNSIVSAIVIIAKGSKDEAMTALAVSMLVQKVGKVNKALDLKIIAETATLAADGGVSEFRSLLRLYRRLHQQSVANNDQLTLRAVADAGDYLSTILKGGSELYGVYLHHILETIVGLGEVPRSRLEKHKDTPDFEVASQEIAFFLKPLALLIANNLATEGIEAVESFPSLQRDAWYNLVVHGFSTKSLLVKRYIRELKIIARYSRPLIDEELANKPESDIELNTTLRRGKSSENYRLHEREMAELLPHVEADIKTLSYQELMFLKAAYLVETLRASTGHCTKILAYFVDPKLRHSHLRYSALGNCMEAVAVQALEMYLSKTNTDTRTFFYTPEVAEQLALVFEACCHRVIEVQRIAYVCAERIINQIPSVLCQRVSLFSLLDLLTIMWKSCLEAETDEYEWTPVHTASHGDTHLQLSDDYNFRRYTLRTFHLQAKKWVSRAINVAPLDVKGLLQTYLSDPDSDEQFGHLSLGRSFAFDMGAAIPNTDQRLGAIEREDDLRISTASDFMSQYTTRQEYRFTDPLLSQGGDNGIKGHMRDLSISSAIAEATSPSSSADIVAALHHMEMRALQKQNVNSSQVRELLRTAASMLCRTDGDLASVAAHFVRIPFVLFSKQMMKFSLSLWMGVIKENPRMEPRILIEIIEGWVTTVRNKLGVFNRHMTHVDPFFLKEEFAPSDKDATLRQQHRAQDQIAPHFRVLQFLASHYTATRLNNSTVENAYLRFLKVTLPGLREVAGHPLAREIHFQIILLGLRFLLNCTTLDATARWRLKDDILSAGLAWFAHPPRWSFGGNRLQMKAETHVLTDVVTLLQRTASMGLHVPSPLTSLARKQQLLETLLSDEVSRLMVWLFPTNHSSRHLFSMGGHVQSTPETISLLLPTAWQESPDLAVNMASRFKSDSLKNELRWYLLNHTEKVMHNADALEIIFGSTLPNDVSAQLKYLLYWAPVNPITAVTYFHPAYRNHPCIIQYAVRALESHSVDVTFFYVPQIVQALRYDFLGYVARSIIETAKFSSLFAHQIIWNMKANAYKDEDSEIPDPVKPTLDKVMEALISSFSPADNDFYEREFAFFNEITSISSKLRPLLKKSKPEKKQKIEEELRQIQVDVGVYLPSNPDGVVVGIDRKSGKPLQSHAKTPFMATFRIRKELADDLENTEMQLAQVNSGSTPTTSFQPTTTTTQPPTTTFEVWQSAIFKVGDDCRQDVLALQMIAAFRGIFHYVGLPVYVFPYRVTATAPGCGVIDVLPNSISRDMLGREAVNGLYEWFIATFGTEDSSAFQVARNNFVKSLAAYSVISWLLQFKDRHNGNIMFDTSGHILHIDFGFCFDIAPGGVRFERAPFKLTKEMVAVMGGSRETQSFRWFEELCVKAFLAARPFVGSLQNLVVCMLDSGLPCFKPETIANFRGRFVLERSEREAADFMRGLVKSSFEALSTRGYDQFQLITNGIPY